MEKDKKVNNKNNNNKNKQKNKNPQNKQVKKQEPKKVVPPKKVEPPKKEEPKKEPPKKVEPPKKEEPIKEEITKETLTVSQIEEMPADPVKPSTMTSAKKAILKRGNKLLGPCLIVLIVILSILAVAKINSPKYIFQKEIDSVYKDIDDNIKDYEDFVKRIDYINKNTRLTTEFILNDPTEDIEDLKVESEINFNLKENFYNANTKLSQNNTTINGDIYFQDNKIYLDSELLEKPIEITNYLTDYVFAFNYIGIDDVHEMLDSTKPDDIRYLLKFIKKELFKTFDSDSFTKENIKKEIDDKTVRLHKITYTIDEKKYKDTFKSIIKALKKDDKSLRIIAKATAQDKSDIKDGLDDLLEELNDIEFDEELQISIYTQGILNNSIGYTIELDGKEYFTYIHYKGYYEIRFDNNDKDDREKITIIGETDKDDVVTYTIKRNKKKVATIVVKENTDEKIDLTFNIPDEEVKGHLMATYKEYKDEVSGDFEYSIEYEDEEYSIEGKYKLENPKTLKEIDPDEVEKLDKNYDFRSIKKLVEKLKDEQLRELVEEFINELEDQIYDLNYNDMIEKTYKEVTTDIKNDDTFLLYVGDQYYYRVYDYYDDEDEELEPESEEEIFLDTIVDLQDEYNFHSVTISQNYYGGSTTKCSSYDKDGNTTKCINRIEYIEDFLKTTEDACTTGYDCLYTKLDTSKRPVAYAIKEGKLVYILDTKSTEEDFDKALDLLGLKNE